MRRHEFESLPFLLFMLLRSFLVTFLSIHISFIFLQLLLKFVLWFRDTGLSKREGSRSLNAGIGWIVDKSASFLIVEPKFRILFWEKVRSHTNSLNESKNLGNKQGGRGNRAVYYTGTQSLKL